MQLRDSGLHARLPLTQSRLVGHLGLESFSHLVKIVRQQSKSRITHVGLDNYGAAGYLRLLAQRLQLTTKFGGEVLQPREVALHRIEFAQGLLFALAMLEHSSGLFHEAATILRCCVQDGVELPLPDNDVHLATDTGIGQQFLNIQQSTRFTVDRVLGSSVAKQRAGDRHLGVLDGKGLIGVVDGECHFRSAQWCAAGRPGEDDVIHLSATKALGSLLTHDPGEGIDDVRLSRAVRPDDACHARLELQGRGRRERFEALERQRLQMHGPANSIRVRSRRRAETRCGEGARKCYPRTIRYLHHHAGRAGIGGTGNWTGS